MRIFKGKSKRTAVFSIITVAVIVILLALNLLLSYFSLPANMYMDMTPEGLFTLTDAMKSECAFVDELGKDDGDKSVKITFCTDPDYLISTYVLRPAYYMALCMQREFDNVEVETVNVENDPTALSEYKTTSLSKIEPTDVIVSYGARYRIISARNFWTSSDGSYFGFNGEYRLATLIKSVTAIEQPSAYFVIDHGESYYDVENPESDMSLSVAEFYDLLCDRGLSVKALRLSEVEAIPDDCALLIINNPRTDFETDPDKYGQIGYVSDLEKLDRYLVESQGAIMIAKDYDEAVSLPRLEDFLHEWGFDFSSSIVRDPESSLEGNHSTDIITVYETEEDSYANAIYGDFASISTSPKTVISNTGYITSSFGEAGYKSESGSMFSVKRYASFLKSSSTASAYLFNESAEQGYVDSEILDMEAQRLLADEAGLDLAALTVRERFISEKNEYQHSYLFCSASPDFFSNERIGNSSYANYDVVSALINNISRTDEYASTELGGTNANSDAYGGKRLVAEYLSADDFEDYAYSTPRMNRGISTTEKVVYSVVVFAVPLAFLIAGVVVLVRRKFL